MSEDELDRARAAEAVRLWYGRERDQQPPSSSVAALAARLTREGWVPVDPDLIEARKVAGSMLVHGPYQSRYRAEIMAGKRDHTTLIRAVLAGINRGREMERPF